MFIFARNLFWHIRNILIPESIGTTHLVEIKLLVRILRKFNSYFYKERNIFTKFSLAADPMKLLSILLDLILMIFHVFLICFNFGVFPK